MMIGEAFQRISRSGGEVISHPFCIPLITMGGGTGDDDAKRQDFFLTNLFGYNPFGLWRDGLAIRRHKRKRR